MGKKLFSMLFMLCLGGGIAITASAEGDTYGISVHGIEITSSNKDDVLGEMDGDLKTVTFDPDSNTLTLHDANLPSDPEKEGPEGTIVWSQESAITDLNICAEGDNTLMRVMITNSAQRTLTFTGSGAIRLTGQFAQIYGNNPDKFDLVFDGITFDVSAHSTRGGSGNIAITGNLMTVKNGAQVAASGDAETPIIVNGMVVERSMLSVKGTGGDGNHGICVWGEITVREGSKVDVEVTNAESSSALCGVEGVTISDSEVTAKAGSYGILSPEFITITDKAKVNASGNVMAIYSYDKAAISGSAVTAASCDDSAICSPEIVITNSVVNAEGAATEDGIWSRNASVSGSWISTSGSETFENQINNSILINGAAGRVVGQAVIPSFPGEVTLQAGVILTVPTGTSFTIPDDVTLFNNGKVNLEGTAQKIGTVICAEGSHVGDTVPCTNTRTTCKLCGQEYDELHALTHANLEKTEAKAATSTADGNIEYYYCMDCGRYFRDPAAQDQIALQDTVIPATGADTDGGGSKKPSTGTGTTGSSSEKADTVTGPTGDKETSGTGAGGNKGEGQTPDAGTSMDKGNGETMGTVANIGKADSPKTGDNDTLTFWAALLLLGGLGFTGTVYYRRKRK